MSIQVTPIETVYKGYKFRSRLEARWAVFFETLGIRWEYEKGGFDLGRGIWYLPDFWLPDVKMWAEVKPDDFTEKEMLKVKLLVQGLGYGCLLLIGPPENKPYSALRKADNYQWFWDKHLPPPCHGCSAWIFCLTTYHKYPFDENRFFSSPGCTSFSMLHEWPEKILGKYTKPCNCDVGYCDAKYEDTQDAVNASRRIRFDGK